MNQLYRYDSYDGTVSVTVYDLNANDERKAWGRRSVAAIVIVLLGMITECR